MSIVDGFNAYYKTFGIRGVFAIFAYRLVGRPREIVVQPTGIRHPIHLRVRTSDLSVYNDILLRAEYAFELPPFPKTIVDVGANIGMASIFYTHRYPHARVIAIEAEASNFSILATNVKPYPNIFPIHAALWNRDGEISVSEPDPAVDTFGKWGFITHEGDGIRVRAITMRSIMAEMEIDMIDILKVDIEGAEKEVFENCDWMQSVGCLVIELHDHFKPGCSEAVNSVVQEFSKLQRGETTFYVRQS